MRWPAAGNVTLKAFGITAASYSGQVKSVKLLGYGDVEFTHDAEGLTIAVPATHPNEIAPVFEITFDEDVSLYDTLQQLIQLVETQANDPSMVGTSTGKYTAASVATLLEAAEAAKSEIEYITADVEVGKTYTGKVVRIMDFGAFVEVLPGKDGLLHVSRISKERVEKVTDVLGVGDTVTVKCYEIDDKGRVNLTRKGLEDTPIIKA